MKKNLYKIVLTGGPCAGKTSSLSYLSDKLTELGYRVFVVPEMATILFSSGYSLDRASSDAQVQFQSSVIALQIAYEQNFTKLANLTEQPTILLLDRGTMDSKAFLPEEMWQPILDENGWSEVGLRDKFYDAVFHLVTTANGAEQYYTLANNQTRTETAAQAKEIDFKLQQSWVGHPHFRVIDNSTNFEGKLQRLLKEICHVLGIPVPLEIEQKYLVKSPKNLPVAYKEIEIEQTYLINATENNELRVRKRGTAGAYVYTQTTKISTKDNVRMEFEKQISSRDYLNLLKQADPKKKTIRKKRRCFIYQNQYFELDIFEDSLKNLEILEVELSEENQAVQLPNFIEVLADVSKDKTYSNAQLALK